ncbi:MAG: glycosyltransferase family 2 protein [Actinomycetota bacterium]
MPHLPPRPQSRRPCGGEQRKEHPLNIKPTIVIPVHNKASLTRQCLNDLLGSPDCSDVEILVVDDGSTDVTGELLKYFEPRVKVLTNRDNAGFASSCNRGVEEASNELVVLLNNDVRPVAGWLAALVEYAEQNPAAAVIGAKLLFANNTVQHAGVVIGRDGNPYHLYAGFPGDHPAVARSRRFQIVTGACMAVRRSIFLSHEGFDPVFVNGHEDVDYCLRLGRSDHGHEVHLCAPSVLYHLESASRDPHSEAARANGRLYRERWAARVVPDDLDYYIEDGLLTVEYSGGYPLELKVSPELATAGAMPGTGKLLRERSGQVFELLKESTRLSVELAEAALPGTAPVVAAGLSALPPPDEAGAERELELDREIEAALWELQKLLGERAGVPAPGRWLEYRGQVQQLRDLICRVTPPGARVAVVSRGDDRLIDLPDRTGEHLPQDETGGFAGFYPANGAEAVDLLQALRARGTGYLAIPAGSRWWLEHYPEFAAYLEGVGAPLVREKSGALWALAEATVNA